MPSLLSDNSLLSFNSLLPDDASNKANELLDKLNQKKVALGKQYIDYDNLEVVDGDTVHKKDTGEQFRLQFDKSGYSIDPYETNHGDKFTAQEDTQKKLSRQRQYLTDQLNKDKWFDFTKAKPEDITNEMIFAKGEEAKQRLVNALKDKKGIELNTWGEDKFHRGLTDIRLDGSQDSLLNEINTPELNTGYNYKSNSIQKLKDSLYGKTTVGDAVKDAVASFGSGMSIQGGEVLLGGLNLVQQATKKALTLGENKDIKDAINNVPSITDQFQKLGYDLNRTKQILDPIIHSQGFLDKSKELEKISNASDNEWENAIASIEWASKNPEHITTGLVAESLPMMLMGMGITGKFINGIKANVATRLAGASPEYITQVTSQVLKNNLGKIIGVGALAEGSQTAGLIANQADLHGRTQDEYALPAFAAGLSTGGINVGLGRLATAEINLLTKGALGGFKGNAVSKLVKSISGETLEEGLQTYPEQVLTNIAEGEDNIFKGTGSQTALGAIAGGVTGGGMVTPQIAIDALKSALNASSKAKQEELVKATANPMKDATEVLNSYNSADTLSPEMDNDLVKAATDLGIDTKNKPITEIHNEITKATKYSSVEDYQAIKEMNSDTDLNQHITNIVGSKVSNDIQIEVLEQFQKKDPTSFETRKEELQPKLDKLYQQSTTKNDPNLIADNIHTSKLTPLATESIQVIDKEANKTISDDPTVLATINPNKILDHVKRITYKQGKTDLSTLDNKLEYQNVVNTALAGFNIIVNKVGINASEEEKQDYKQIHNVLAKLETHILENTDMTNKAEVDNLIKSNFGSVAPEGDKSVSTEELEKRSKDTTDKVLAARATTTLKLRGVYAALQTLLGKTKSEQFEKTKQEIFEGTGSKPAIKEHQLLVMAAMDSDKPSSKAATKTALNDFGKWINYHSEKQIELTKVNQAIIKHGVDSQQAVDALVSLNTWAKSKNVVNIEGNAREYKISKKNGKLKFSNLTEQVTLEAKAMQIAFHALRDEASVKFGKEDLLDAMSHLLDTEVVTTPVVSEEDNSTVQTEEDLVNRFNEEQAVSTEESKPVDSITSFFADNPELANDIYEASNINVDDIPPKDRVEEYKRLNITKLDGSAITEEDISNNPTLYQNLTESSNEDYVASEKTIRDLADRIAHRIGLKVVYIADRTQKFKGKVNGKVATINLAYATLDTPIHEILGHPIIASLKGTPLYQNLIKELETGRGKEVLDKVKKTYKESTLEDQQEEAIVELLGLYTADRLNAVEDGKLVSLLKRVLKEMKAFLKDLFSQREVDIMTLPDAMTLGDLADLLAFRNSKLILPGNEVTYTTPDNQKFKTYQEASSHLAELIKQETIDLSLLTDLDKELISFYDPKDDFTFKNKEYEQSNEIIQRWKVINNIKYNPEEVYSRGQGFYSIIGAYSDFDVKLMMQNLLAHIEDNNKAGGEFLLSVLTKPVDKRLKHIEGTGGKIRFRIFPKSEDIKWAANKDVFSGSVWDASEKIDPNTKSELLGVSYSKSPSLDMIDSIQPNLASIIDEIDHAHNELAIALTSDNFRLEYDDDISYSTKLILDSVNSILDKRYGKIIEPSIDINPTQTKNTIKENINSVKDKVLNKELIIGSSFTKNNKEYRFELNSKTKVLELVELKRKVSHADPEITKRLTKQDVINLGLTSEFVKQHKQALEKQAVVDNKYDSQAKVNLKVAALKKGQRRYPRSLIRSEVSSIKITYDTTFDPDFDMFQLVSDEELTPKQRLQRELSKEKAIKQYTDYINSLGVKPTKDTVKQYLFNKKETTHPEQDTLQNGINSGLNAGKLSELRDGITKKFGNLDSKIFEYLTSETLEEDTIVSRIDYIAKGLAKTDVKDKTNKDYLFGLELGREEANNKFLEWQANKLNTLTPIPGVKEAINYSILKPIKVLGKAVSYVLFNKLIPSYVSKYYGKFVALLKDSTKETVFTKYPDLFRNLENNTHIISQLKSIEGKVAIDTIAEFVESFHNEYVKANTKVSSVIDIKNFTSEIGKKFSKDIQAQLAEFARNNPKGDLNVEALLKYFNGNDDVLRFINKFAKVLLNVEANPSLLLHNDTDEVIDRNITAQLGLHALSWMINTGTKTLYTEREMTLHMLGKEETTAPSDEAMAALSTMGLVRGYVANQMSGSIVNYMGFKPNDSIPAPMFPKFETALGLSAIDTLERMGYVEYKGIPQASMNAFMTGEDTVGYNYTSESEVLDKATIFVRIKSDLTKNNEPILAKHVKELFDKVKPGNKEIQEIFNIELVETEYSATPWERAKLLDMLGERNGILTFGNSRTQYAKDDKKAVLKGAMSAFDNRTAANDLANKLGDEFLKEINFEKKLDAEDHVGNIESNKGLLSSTVSMLDSWKELNDLGEVVYFYYKKMYQGRFQGVGSGHPQTNKLVRWTRSLWKGEVNKDYSDPTFKQFMQAVIEGYKFKYPDITLQSKPAMMTDEEIAKVFDRLHKELTPVLNLINKDTLTEAEKNTIVQAIHAGGEKYHTMAVLAALSEYHSTVGNTFTTTLMREIDGITNGPLISLIMMSGVNSDISRQLLKAAGVNIDGESYLDFVNSTPVNDVYKLVAFHLNRSKQSIDDSIDNLTIRIAAANLPTSDTYIKARLKILRERLPKDHRVYHLLEQQFNAGKLNKNKYFTQETDESDESFKDRVIKGSLFLNHFIGNELNDLVNQLNISRALKNEITSQVRFAYIEQAKEERGEDVSHKGVQVAIKLIEDSNTGLNLHDWLNGVHGLIGDIDRTFAKNPTTVTIFGGSSAKIAAKVAGETIAKINNTLVKISKMEGNAQTEAIAALQINIQNVLGHDISLWQEFSDAEDKKKVLLTWQLEKEDKKHLREAIIKVYDPLIKNAVDVLFRDLLANRGLVNNVYQLTNKIFKHEFERKVDELVKQGITITAEDIDNILLELQPLMPDIAIFNAEDTPEQRLQLWKEELAKQGKPEYKVQIKSPKDSKYMTMMGLDEQGNVFESYIINEGTDNEIKIHVPQSASAYAKDMIIAAMSVRAPITSTHNADSHGIQQLLIKFKQVLGIHDASMQGLDQVEEVSIAMNEALFNLLANYNYFNEIVNHLKRVQDYTKENKNIDSWFTGVGIDIKQAKKEGLLKDTFRDDTTNLGNIVSGLVGQWATDWGQDSSGNNVKYPVYNSFKAFIDYFDYQADVLYQQVQDNVITPIKQGGSFGNYSGQYPFVPEYTPTGTKEEQIVSIIESGLNQDSTITKPEVKPNEETSTKVGFTLKGKSNINPALLRKDQGKANIANAYIGYGIKGSSTEAYLNDAQGNVPTNESINPTKDTVVFVSVNGNKQLTLENKAKTLEQIKRVLNAGGIIVMDNSRIANTTHNKSGEGVIQQELQYIPGIGMMEVNGNNQYKMISTSTQTNKDNNLGSQESTATNLFESINSLGNIDSTNILDTAERLENVGNVRDEDTHTTHLKSILGGFISKVLQPLQYFEMTSPEANIGEYDPTHKRIGLNISNAPIAPTVKVPMSALTTFVHELVHSVTASALFNPKNSVLRSRVQKIFNHIERNISNKDKEKYSHIFANKNKTTLDNKSVVNHGLAELIAFAETEPMFRELLNSLPKMTVGKITETWDESKDKFVEANLLEIISNVFNKIMVWWNDKIKGEHSTDVLTQLHTLTVQLSTAHLKVKSTILDFKIVTDTTDNFVLNKVHNLIVKPLIDLLGSNYFVLNKNKDIKSSADSIRRIYTSGTVESMFKTVDIAKDYFNISEEHWLTYSLNEITGQIAVGNFTQALNMTKKLRDKVVATIQSTISSNLRAGFKTNLTKQLERVIYNTLLKTDLSSLQDYYKDDLLNMFDGSKRKVEQDKLKKEILKNKNGKLYLGHAYNTAFFMVKNQATKSFQHSTLMNATQIYNMQGSNFKPVGDRDSTIELIDKLIGLYALDLVNQDELNTLKELFNTDSHGLNMTMEVHRQQKERHLNDILKGNKSLIVKGSTKELTNPNRQIIIATAAEEEKLKLHHYTKGNKIVYEGKELYVYHSKFRLMQPWVQGIISYTHMNNILSDMKGVMKQSDGLDQIIQDSELDKKAKAKMLDENIRNANKTVFDTTEAEYTLNPVFNGKGYVSKHSFMLSNQDKENLLDMNTNFTHVLGAMVANITDKLNTQRLNDESAKILIKDRMDNLETKGIQWITLSKDAKTKNERDIWNKLTPEFKKTIRDLSGSKEVVVNAKLLKMIFGQRKLSLSDFFRPADEQELSTFVKYFGSQLYPYIKKVNLDRTTQVWQEGIGYIKDQLVVKSGTVLGGNEISNLWIGFMEGMTLKQYIKAKIEALKLVIEYHKLNTQINDIEYLLKYDKEMSSTMRTNLETKLSNLTSTRNLSLVKKYEDAGQMKTIVEDGLEDENIWSFRNEFFESRIKSVTDKLPKPIKAIGREVFMTHDTKMYQLMKDLTQMSDLTSRIAVGEFKQSHGMTEKEALQLVDEAFINYDIPSHQNVQFAADMGLFMFNKFFFRIQSVIAREVGQHPARFLTLLGMEQVFGAQEAIHHSLMTPDTIAGHFSAPWKLPFAIWDENFYNNLFSFHAPVYQPV